MNEKGHIFKTGDVDSKSAPKWTQYIGFKQFAIVSRPSCSKATVTCGTAHLTATNAMYKINALHNALQICRINKENTHVEARPGPQTFSSVFFGRFEPLLLKNLMQDAGVSVFFSNCISGGRA